MTYTQQEIASMLLTAELVTKCSHCHNTFDFGQAHMGASAKTVEGLEKPIFDEVDKQHAAFTEMKTESDPTESLKKSAARSTSITTGKIMSGLVTLHNDYPFSSTKTSHISGPIPLFIADENELILADVTTAKTYSASGDKKLIRDAINEGRFVIGDKKE